MTFEIFKAFPPDRDSPVAELNVRHEGSVDVPAEVYRENDELRIAIFGREGGVAWNYSLDEWEQAVKRAREVVGDK